MDWIKEAKEVFSSDKPEHFTNYTHCGECLEHDETLLGHTIDTIGLEALGNPGWDPICFSSVEGIKYYMPAFIRLSLSTIKNEFYLEQFLFHLKREGKDNNLFQSCNKIQRDFIVKFIEYIILKYAKELEFHGCETDIFKVREVWANA